MAHVDSLTARLAFAAATGIVLPPEGPLPPGCEGMYRDMIALARQLEAEVPGWTIGDLARLYLTTQLDAMNRRAAQ